jgi:predicted RNA binding protein YcfA (HicA-like mRNA interferase family)
MKVRDILAMLRADGWYIVTTRGSHRQFKHRTRRGRVTIAGRLNDELARGTLKSVFRQAGWKSENENAIRSSF